MNVVFFFKDMLHTFTKIMNTVWYLWKLVSGKQITDADTMEVLKVFSCSFLKTTVGKSEIEENKKGEIVPENIITMIEKEQFSELITELCENKYEDFVFVYIYKGYRSEQLHFYLNRISKKITKDLTAYNSFYYKVFVSDLVSPIYGTGISPMAGMNSSFDLINMIDEIQTMKEKRAKLAVEGYETLEAIEGYFDELTKEVKELTKELEKKNSDSCDNHHSILSKYDPLVKQVASLKKLAGSAEDIEKIDLMTDNEDVLDIDTDFTTLTELINFVETCELKNNKILRIKNCLDDLKKLNEVIGLGALKNQLLDIILSAIQTEKFDQKFNTVLLGKPGCGKTMIAKYIGNILCKLIFNAKDGKFTQVGAADLIGQYVGQTYTKTQTVINRSRNGVLFIDEIYALSDGEGGKSFSKECIDVLCNALLEEPIICIIAGYEDEVEKRFFQLNKGLSRRFPFTFKIEPYSADELRQIFIFKMKDNDMSCVPDGFFEKNYKKFPFYGGSIDTFINFIKMTRDRRCAFRNDKVFIYKDIEAGFQKYSENLQIDDGEKAGKGMSRYMQCTMYS